MSSGGACRIHHLVENPNRGAPKDMPARAIVSEMMRLLQSVLTECEHCELSSLERKAVEFGRRAAELALGEMLANQGNEPVVVRCSCGGSACIKDKRERSQVTLAGTHVIRRARYHCSTCGSWIYPRDVELGIGSSNYSAGVVALTSEVAAGFPFGPCEGFLARRFGLDMCYKQVQRIAERTGTVLVEAELQSSALAVLPESAVDSEESTDVMTISADGLMVHADGTWTEMKVGTVLGECGRSSIATLSRCEQFGKHLYLEALRRGLRHAGRVVFVADGAVWIWNLAAEHFPGAVEIVDWYHAVGHLWEIANDWHGEGTPKAKLWVKHNKARLAEDGVARVIASLRQWKPASDEQAVTKRENLHYFTTNANRMLYRTFRAAGYYIGSGSVESACKQYGHGRLKQAGMRWKHDGIEAIAHLRSALLNNRTDNILEAAKIAA
jgi:hypothetical protein